MSDDVDLLLGVGAAAARVGRTRRAVHAAIAAGRIPALAVEVGGGRHVWLVRQADVDRTWKKRVSNP
ncbi:hypothetical protein [Mycobacteroides abscessus]|uniref:hypothetical protein n=1 Tax=Mycobacteroides abscessus TaxID=36809 RepID=UPI0019CFEE75|nr:hypothetical protein [Mycobacteroides abscessus]MBN7311797.1 hypothetical protein [Mycobacteroides abscessus subsp. abscessus]